MKKLIGFAVVLFLVCCLSVFAGSANDTYKSFVGDNSVLAVCVVKDTICIGTNGGLELFQKDSTKKFSNGLSWQVFTTLNSPLPSNYVRAVAMDSSGNIYAGGDGWMVCKSGNSWTRIPAQQVEQLLIVSDGPNYVKWAIMTRDNKHGLYVDNGMGFMLVPLPSTIPLSDCSVGFSKIAVGNYGNGLDSSYHALWGTFPNGVYSYDLISGNCKVWLVGTDLIAGAPLNIAASGDTVVVTGESGVYFFANGKNSNPVVIAYPSQVSTQTQPPSMPRNNAGSIAIMGGNIYVASRDGQLYRSSFSGPFSVAYGNNAGGDDRVGANCLITDGSKLYWGTDWHLMVYPPLVNRSITGIRYPHDNNITHINRDNTGRILVGGYFGGYRYENNSQSPILNNGEMNVSGPVLASFVDNKNAEWVWENTKLTRNGEAVNLPVSTTGLNYPFWLLQGPSSSASDLWLLTSDPVHRLQVYAGEGTWGNQLNTPEELAKEEILSASSNGKKLWIGTDSAVYSYDFIGSWTRYERGYSRKRFVIGADETVYVFDYDNLNNCYRLWDLENRIGTKSFPQGREINSVYKKDSTFWIATNSGAYYLNLKEDERIGSFWQDVPLRIESGYSHTLADDYVNTIYVDSATNSVWFGTQGGLTVWHRPQATSVKQALKPAIKLQQQSRFFDSKTIDLRGRKIGSSDYRSACGVNIVQLPNGGMVKNLNLNRSAKRR